MILNKPVHHLVMLLTLLSITIVCIKAKAQGPAPQLAIAEDMPDTDVVVKRVTYGNGVFLACLIHPTRLYKSADGMSWSKIKGPDLGADTNINNYRQNSSIAYGAGRFVLAADSGRIFSSSDLLTWTASASGTTHNINTVKYLNGSFYAVGDSAVFLSSPDGLNWMARQTGLGDITGSYQDVFFGNDHLVITAYNHIGSPNGTQVVYDSSGGSWTSDSSRQFFNRHGFARGRFYEFGPDSVSVSTDMQHWSAVSLPANAVSGSDVFEDSAHVYLVSANYDTVNASPVWRSKITSSDDGIHFGALYPTLVPGSGGGAYLNHRYFIFGVDAVGPLEGSADGLHYRVLGSTVSLLATNGSTYVKLSVTPEETHLYSSSDLTNWTPRDTVTGAVGLAYDGTKFWAVGSQTYTSTDGAGWTDAGPSAHYFNGIAYGDGRFIGWSRDVNLGPDSLWYSTDGNNWIPSTTPTESNPPQAPPTPINYGSVKRVRFLNGYIFVICDGRILYSTDGASYDLAFRVDTLYVADVAYVADSAKFYFFAFDGNGPGPSYLITDPLDPPFVPAQHPFITDTISGLPFDMQLSNFQSVTYNQGHFVSVVGNMVFPPYPNSYLLYSGNGTHWGSHLLDRETQFTSMIARGDTFNIEGTHNYHILADFSGSVPLPVSLLNFNAVVRDDTHVLLTWQTANEQNSRQFIIQRNTGTQVWDSIGALPAAGDSRILRDYSFTDDHPIPGYNNYRLLMTDADNSYKASEIRRVLIGDDTRIKVFPNPAKDQVIIQRMADEGVTTVTLYDAAGRVMVRRVFTGYTFTLSLERLPAGIYHLTMRQSNGEVYQKDILH